MRESLQAAGAGGRIEVIPNGVDLERFRPPADLDERYVLRERLRLPANAEIVTFIGGYLNHRKGVDLLADAWRAIASARPRAHLLLVGPTVDSFRAEDPQRAFLEAVHTSLRASGAMDRVSITGAVGNVEEYLRAADVFVFPSRREGMPNVVLEAYASGVASVVCPFVGMSEEFGVPGEHYVLAEHDPADLARKMLGLLEDPRRREDLGNSARTWVSSGLTLNASLDAYRDLYLDGMS